MHKSNAIRREPVAIIEAIKTTINLLIVWLVVMGYWPMAEEQQAITISLALALVNLGGTIWQRQLSTPVSDPRDGLGRRLTPEGE